MKDPRLRHVTVQFDARHTLPYWSRWDESVDVPWWLAIPGYPIVIGCRIVVWAGAVPFAALRNLLSWRSPSTEDLPHDAPFVLVLRTFGHDGTLLLTSSADDDGVVPRAATLEQLVGEIADELGLAAVGFADHDLRNVPGGIRYAKTDNERWRAQFERLAHGARAIVVMSTPGQAIGDSFRGELDYLSSAGLTAKTIVIGPPQLDREVRQAFEQTYAGLGWPAVKHVYLVAYMGADGRLTVRPSLGGADAYLAERYREALSAALRGVLSRQG